MKALWLIAAGMLSACASAPAQVRAPLPNAPSIASCDGAADVLLCFLRLGMHDASSYDPGDFGLSLEVAPYTDIAPIRAAIAFGLDRGPDAIFLGDDPKGIVVMQRAIMEALRRDSAGHSPDAAPASIAALEETGIVNMEPGGVRYRAYTDVAKWRSPFLPHRPSAPLARLASAIVVRVRRPTLVKVRQ